MKNWYLSILVFLLGGMLTAAAQGVTTASMNGQVVDENKQPLPGAVVLAIHEPTGTEYGAVTNENGIFNIRNMNVGGPYKVEISFVGYKTFTLENIYLQLGQTFRIDARLQTEEYELAAVEVTAKKDDLFDGNRTGAKTVVDETIINYVAPTASRNLTDYLRFTPQSSVLETNDGPAISFAGQNNRFNSIFIDGAVNNDVFGLSGSGTNGGQTGIQPISPDAIEQLSVSLSPYDVTIGGFTGGGINAVTRSGTNNVEGSAYYFFRNQELAGLTPTNDPNAERTKLNDFTSQTYGFRVGGPIVKNKLFFFINGEIQRDRIPQPFDQNYQGNATQQDLDNLRQYLITQYGYDPGDYRDNTREQNGNKLFVKLNWNINKKHQLSLRHSYSYAEELEANRSTSQEINFFNTAEFFPSTTNSTALEWSYNGNNTANKMILGYTAVRDDRGYTGNPFPFVTIIDGNGEINFGSEQFSIGNELNQDILTLTNNFSIYKGRHTITLGTHNEYYNIYNLFIRQNFGSYTYSSLQDFLNDAGPSFYTRTYVLKPSIDAAQGDAAKDVAAQFRVLQTGWYAQDEFQVNNRLKITGGLRIDIPFFLDKPEANENFNQNTLPLLEAEWGDLKGAKSGNMPSGVVMFSPKVGFNYDVKGDQTLQIRGGAGIFTGRIPFVWPGGAYTNNGVYLATINASNPTLASNGQPLPFNPNPKNYVGSDIAGAGSSPSQIDLFTDNFKFPQVFRTSLAVDYKLPMGWVATVEGIYTKNINYVYYRNLNIQKPTQFLNTPYGDNRPIYNGQKVDPAYDRVIWADNTNEGYTYNLTASLSRPFSNNWTAGLSYTFGRAMSLHDGLSSQNSSNWRRVESTDKNNLDLGFSDFDLGSRINAYVAYRFEYSKYASTMISLFYNGQSGDRFSYTYNGAIGGNDQSGGTERSQYHLIYVPRDASEINLVDYVDGNGNTITAAQQWEALNKFIEDDPYLRKYRGEIAPRNAGRTPFTHIVDLKLMQEFKLKMNNGKENRLQITFDVFNFTNLLNKNWGRRYFISRYRVINFAGYESDGVTPQFTFDVNTKKVKDFATIDDSGINSSRWQAQLGIRYIFQ
ncbi:TonB-dependent receptor [Thermonema rossianum]|uniref:TonB-dependent receptor n=1 Tax=Thermonema rossianum TaxID=55505 RepID=UPI000570F78C|nr:carboxypeptidase regulatory-like domain-containing protein [Thermonema rossianum]